MRLQLKVREDGSKNRNSGAYPKPTASSEKPEDPKLKPTIVPVTVKEEQEVERWRWAAPDRSPDH